MAKASSGVYQLPNGTWGFRYAFWVDGKQKDIKRTKDENGNPFKTDSTASSSEGVFLSIEASWRFRFVPDTQYPRKPHRYALHQAS